MAVNIKVDRERMGGMVSVDEYIALLDGDVRTMINILSMFVVGDDGSYLDKKDGRKLIGKLTLDEMREAIQAFTENAENAIVPPPSGAV